MVERQKIKRMVKSNAGRWLFLRLPITANQSIGRTVVRQHRFGGVLELGNDPLSQSLAELYSPLIEGVDAPNRALSENAVLVQCNSFPSVSGVSSSAMIVVEG